MEIRKSEREREIKKERRWGINASNAKNFSSPDEKSRTSQATSIILIFFSLALFLDKISILDDVMERGH